MLRAPWGGRTLEPGAAAAAEVAEPAQAAVMLRAPIDRSDPIDVFSIDVPVKTPDGTVLEILRRPFGYPSGRLPGDPGPVPPGFDPRTEICHVLSPAAAARCLFGRGYL